MSDPHSASEARAARSLPVSLEEARKPSVPTQAGPHGIRFDFNEGARVTLPPGGPWRVRLSDLDTASILFETTIADGGVKSAKKYFVRFGIEVWKDDASVFHHELDLRDRPVLIEMLVQTLGDSIAWLPQITRFQAQHGCRMTLVMAPWLIPIFRDAYPEITFTEPGSVTGDDYYATYKVMAYFGDENHDWQPSDYRLVGLGQNAAYTLGVEMNPAPPRLGVPDLGRPIVEPYVCIATQSTAQAKYWNNPEGWPTVIAFLKRAGYRVVCIDRAAVHGGGLVSNEIPRDAEDETGDRPLAERVRWLRYADFFIGLSSGLSWLAWTAGTPVVMISGFTHPTNEFTTPYRVINFHACNSCWNDLRIPFVHDNFLWCPRLQNTPRQFECTRLITPQQVIQTIRRIPGFATRSAAT